MAAKLLFIEATFRKRNSDLTWHKNFILFGYKIHQFFVLHAANVFLLSGVFGIFIYTTPNNENIITYNRTILVNAE